MAHFLGAAALAWVCAMGVTFMLSFLMAKAGLFPRSSNRLATYAGWASFAYFFLTFFGGL